jgi:hypothetical protein
MKVLRWIVLAMVVIAGGAGVWLYLHSGGLLKDAIETYGSEALGVPLEVQEVVLHLEQGAGEMKGVTVGQPAGFGEGHLLEVGTVRLGIAIDQNNGTNDVWHLTGISLADARLNVVAQGKATNVEALADQVDQRMTGTSGTGTQTSATATSPEIRLIIDHLDLTGMRAQVTSDVLGSFELPLPDIHERRIGVAEGGLPPAAIAEAIVRPLSKKVTRELIRKGLDTDALKAEAKAKVKEKANAELKRLTDRLKSRD